MVGMSFFDRVVELRDSIQNGLRVESVFLCVERSHRWFRHLARMPPGHPTGETVSGMANWEEAPGADLEHAEEILSAGLEMPCVLLEELGLATEVAAPATQTRISGGRQSNHF